MEVLLWPRTLKTEIGNLVQNRSLKQISPTNESGAGTGDVRYEDFGPTLAVGFINWYLFRFGLLILYVSAGLPHRNISGDGVVAMPT